MAKRKKIKKPVRFRGWPKFMAGTCTLIDGKPGWLVRRWGLSNDDGNPHNKAFRHEDRAKSYARKLNRRRAQRNVPRPGESLILFTPET